MAYPKTIIITAVPNRSGTDLLCRRASFQQGLKPSIQGKPISILGDSPKTVKIISMHPKKPLTVVNEQTPFMSPRKRQRLDHLSMEEKIMRRKLKNRVAAQSARDRKKMKMEELEVVVQQLESEKADLEEENARLKNMNMLLETENQFLKQETASQKQVKQEPVNDLKGDVVESVASLEHASLINEPLPKGQEQHPLLSPWMMLFACLQMMMNPISSTSWNNTVRTSSNVEYNLKPLIRRLEKMDLKTLEQLLLKWWGPQQKNWNPSKN